MGQERKNPKQSIFLVSYQRGWVGGNPFDLSMENRLWHVWQRALLSGVLDDLVIATCDKQIKEVAESFGAKVVMTSVKHTRANDRVAEVASKMPCKIVLNIQDDEPALNPRLIRDVVRRIRYSHEERKWVKLGDHLESLRLGERNEKLLAPYLIELPMVNRN